MNNFLFNVLAGIVATGICCAIKYIHKKVKDYSKANKSSLNK